MTVQQQQQRMLFSKTQQKKDFVCVFLSEKFLELMNIECSSDWIPSALKFIWNFESNFRELEVDSWKRKKLMSSQQQQHEQQSVSWMCFWQK